MLLDEEFLEGAARSADKTTTPRAHQSQPTQHDVHVHREALLKVFNLISNQADCPVRVDTLKLHGVTRTRERFLDKLLRPVLHADTLSDLLRSLRTTAYRMERLGLFREVDVALDAAPSSAMVFGNPDPRQAVDVLLVVKEQPKWRSYAGTMFGNGEGTANAFIAFNNLLGIADKFEAAVSHGFNSNSTFTATIRAPVDADPDKEVQLSAFKSIAIQVNTSSFSEDICGSALKYSFLSRWGGHVLGYELAWRKICAQDMASKFMWAGQPTTPSFSVRSQAGHSLKSSISHTFVRDSRDDPLLPTSGRYLKIKQEFAGLGGDVDFVKHEFEAQASTQIRRKTALTGSLKGGLLIPLWSNSSRINDRFFLGSMSGVRGFRHNGLGARDSGDALGGDVYLAAGASLVSPLPKVPRAWPLLGHAWVNAGSLVPLDKRAAVAATFAELAGKPSVAAGFGLVYHYGVRLELNVCVPLVAHRGEQVQKGLHFGMSISSL